jgi:N-glycosylase/DNA lyase
MKIQTSGNGILIKECQHFNLENTFDNGQCFRWSRISQSHYRGVVYGQVIHVEQCDDGIQIYPTTLDCFNKIWRHYFDLERDYVAMGEKIHQIDAHLTQALSTVAGLRILNQDPWETTISFIISANNNIVRIKKIINQICQRYGETIQDGVYTFPSPEILAQADISDLRACGLGYRDRYVLEAANQVASGQVDLSAISILQTHLATGQLVKVSGVGKKVAQCIQLFSMSQEDAIPVDTWITKIFKELYGDENETRDSIEVFFREKFGSDAGYAQQVLFHWARQNNFGK